LFVLLTVILKANFVSKLREPAPFARALFDLHAPLLSLYFFNKFTKKGFSNPFLYDIMSGNEEAFSKQRKEILL